MFHPQPHINLIRKLKPQTQNHFHVLLKSFSYITKNLFQATESSYRLMFHPRLPSHPKRFFCKNSTIWIPGTVLFCILFENLAFRFSRIKSCNRSSCTCQRLLEFDRPFKIRAKIKKVRDFDNKTIPLEI